VNKTPFSERPPREQALIVGVISIALAVVAAAQRDLSRRPADQIRGSKALWRLLCLNAVGALIYFRWGRARTND
jgi:hypothetical protein